MADIALQVDGSDSFVLGMDSYTQPIHLQNGEYANAMNIINRTGIASTRPGTRSRLVLPSGNLQGCTFFSMVNGSKYLVFAVDGKVYVSGNPFRSYYQLPNIQFSPYSKSIAWAHCLKSTDFDAKGVLYYLDSPISVLMMQDGVTRAAYWDGTNSGHLNPTRSPAIPETLSISAATNASPIVLTIATNTLIKTGDVVVISGVLGNTAANGTNTVTVIDSSHISIDGSTGNADYISGGTVTTLPGSGGDIPTVKGYDGTPIGLWMVWSNNRLWLSYRSQVFASDIGNPMKFTESQYLAEARSFYMPAAVTGIVETPDKGGIICFTEEVGVYLQSSIADRTTWLSTPGFQQTVIPNIGCCSPRSVVHQYGLLWWMTPRGVISQNSALNNNISSRMDLQDNEMIVSKSNLSEDLSMVAGGTFENYLIHAVPNGDSKNTRIHVLDLAPFESNANSWQSYWTGPWNPVEFAYGSVRSKKRIFLASKDNDGVNRIWEMFMPDQTDNGVPITSFIESRQHLYGNRDWKKFRYAEIEVYGLYGATAIKAEVSGLKGAYQEMMTKDINAILGQVYHDGEYGDGGELIAGTSSQMRIIRTIDSNQPSECNSECVESIERGLIDKAFKLKLTWSGIGGIGCYRMFAQGEPRAWNGICEANETGVELMLNSEKCGTIGLYGTTDPYTTYTSTQAYTSGATTKTATETSIISQVDADRKALATAQWLVFEEEGILA